MRTAVVLLAWAVVLCAEGRKQGSPLDHLPKNIEVLTNFGERADFSPDNQRVAFMAKSFGDAFVIDLKTRAIRCLTCGVPGAAFLRVMHLVSGDYILIGPERFKELGVSRHADNELWFLSKTPGSKPVKFNQRMSEGAAISKKNLRIAFSETSAQNKELAPGSSRLIVADVDPAGPSLKNQRAVYESKSRDCVIEAQDFYENDSKMTFTCYQPKGLAAVMTIDLASGRVEDQSKADGWYNEVEGIWYDGKYTLVEADRQVETLGGNRGMRNIDIWKLKLDGTGKDFVRLTNFNDYEGWKASNPVVSTDGRYMAFQIARTADEAGVGYGICLYRIRQ
jgi:Tol biopolymer transport system component